MRPRETPLIRARFAAALVIAVAGVAGCTAVLGYPDRVGLDAIATAPEGGGDVDGPVGTDGGTDGATPDVEGGAAADASDGGCTVPSCPVAAYDFDEGVGTTTRDKSGNKNDGTLMGAMWATGKVGSAVSFNGANVFVQVPSSPSLDIAGTHITLAFWAFVVDDQTHDHVLLSKAWMNGALNAPYYQYGVEFGLAAKTYDFFLGTVDGTPGVHKLSIPATPTSTWTHVAFTYDGATMRGYLNGVMAGQLAATGAIPARGTAFRMGVDALAAQGFSGRLDALRIYDRTLTVQEIVALRDGQ